MARDARFEALENPGVEVSIIYSNHKKTESKIYYKKETKERTLKKKIATPDKIEY